MWLGLDGGRNLVTRALLMGLYINDTIKKKASEASFTDLSCGLQAGGHVWTRQRADRSSGSGRKIGITEVTQGVRSKSRRAPDRGLGGCESKDTVRGKDGGRPASPSHAP